MALYKGLRRTNRACVLTIAVGLCATAWSAPYSGGTGTADNPYQVATAADLIALGETPADYDKHFILTADIDLDPNLPGRKVFDKAVIAPGTNRASEGTLRGRYHGVDFSAIPFAGVFDGNGHTISHLTIQGTSHLGLFGYLSHADVRDLGVVDVRISGSGCCVGALAGSHGIALRWGGTITRCYSSGVVSGTDYVGGLIGFNDRGFVRRSFWNRLTCGCFWYAYGTGADTSEMCDIRTYEDAGWDFAGEVEDGTHDIWQMPEEGGYPVLAVFSGYVRPELQGQGTPDDPYLIGNALELGAIMYHSPTAYYRLTAPIDLSGMRWSTAVIPEFAGTLDGNGLTISHLTIAGEHDFDSGETDFGLIGLFLGGDEIRDLGVMDVNITATGDYVGGLSAVANGHVSRCYTTGVVHGNECVGGLIGSSSATVTQCYSAVAVSGESCLGGLVGENEHGSVTQCYSTGTVRGESYIGGLLGSNGGTAVQCYSTGLVRGAGEGVGGLVGESWHGSVTSNCFWDEQASGQTASAGGMGLTTGAMQTANTFINAGWDLTGEPAKGMAGVWWIEEGKDYPRLCWEGQPGRVLPAAELSDLLHGDGTKENPFEIHTPEELNAIGLYPCEWGKHYRLMADLDMGDWPSTQFNRLGTEAHRAFTGVFDGNGYAISGFTYQPSVYVHGVGLFGCVGAPAEIRNICLVAPVVQATQGYDIGALAGSLVGGTVVGCRVEGGTVTGIHTTGGLIGRNGGGIIAHCRVTAAVAGGFTTGGLVGSNSGTVMDCFVGGAVTAGECTGGLVGRNGGAIAECCTIDVVTGADHTGGLVGDNSGAIVNCYSTATVTSGATVGGLTGPNWGTITTCYSAGTVSATPIAGGLAGLSDGGSVSYSFWDREASGRDISAGGTAETTAQMRTAATYLDAGWDFAGETANGTKDIWWIEEGQDYPRLWWEAMEEGSHGNEDLQSEVRASKCASIRKLPLAGPLRLSRPNAGDCHVALGAKRRCAVGSRSDSRIARAGCGLVMLPGGGP